MVCLESASLKARTMQLKATQKKKVSRSKLRMKEYCNLKAIVPALASRQSVTKVTVVEEAIKYIDQLQMALCDRLYSCNDNDKEETSTPYMATVEECTYPEPSPRAQEIFIEVNPHYDPRCHPTKKVVPSEKSSSRRP